MRKEYFICVFILFFICIFTPLIEVRAKDYGNYDTGSCIDSFGEITFISAGSENDVGGKAIFRNKNNNLDWNSDPVSYDVEVQATTSHKITRVGYSIESKDGYSCTGVITGPLVENNDGSVTFHVNIDKGWVDDMAFWGKSVNRNDSTKFDTTESRKVNVNRQMSDAELEAINQELEIGVGETMQCNTLQHLIDKYWSWVMILAPVGTILLITFDFVGPILSSDADALKKASDKAFKRAIALCILIILPFIVNILFGLFGIETCF